MCGNTALTAHLTARFQQKVHRYVDFFRRFLFALCFFSLMSTHSPVEKASISKETGKRATGPTRDKPDRKEKIEETAE